MIYVSIVGVDQVPLSYYRIKLEVEHLVEACGLPWTIQRVTQFHNLLLELLQAAARLPVIPLPARTSFQPIDVGDVAARLVDLVTRCPAGRASDLGGPQVLPAADLARDYLQVFGRRRTILPVRIPGVIGRRFRDGGHLSRDHAEGRRTFREFAVDQRNRM